PEFSLPDVEALGVTLPELSAAEREAVEIRVKYAGYIRRAEIQLRAEDRSRDLSLGGVDFAAIGSLSNEAREKLVRLQPQTVEQASRISGVRHADISALLVHLKGRSVSRET
ncbi:tRNA uridine-5-carboxymethylaminomethyl(34) synthesis enzyme MnmG, partial [Deinococcus sp. 14RED07]|nr:tRNA uridine-5-carboxymethylaminomethyl(34) synthesis enzyme MnmG [Deinococcus sp. 14RED07]